MAGTPWRFCIDAAPTRARHCSSRSVWSAPPRGALAPLAPNGSQAPFHRPWPRPDPRAVSPQGDSLGCSEPRERRPRSPARTPPRPARAPPASPAVSALQARNGIGWPGNLGLRCATAQAFTLRASGPGGECATHWSRDRKFRMGCSAKTMTQSTPYPRPYAPNEKCKMLNTQCSTNNLAIHGPNPGLERPGGFPQTRPRLAPGTDPRAASGVRRPAALWHPSRPTGPRPHSTGPGPDPIPGL
jgi:hypothetical protein